jgi:hypothetical protein
MASRLAEVVGRWATLRYLREDRCADPQGPAALNAGPDVEAVAGGHIEHRAGSLPVHLEGEPRSVGDNRAAFADGLLERFHRQAPIAQVRVDASPRRGVGGYAGTGAKERSRPVMR